jgi:miniconductance mechanosensitive channel
MEIAAVLGLCWLLHVLTRRLAARFIKRIVLRSQTNWDDALHDEQVFSRGVALVPIFVAWQAINILQAARGDGSEPSELTDFVTRLVAATAVVLVVRGLLALLTTVNTLYASNPSNRNRPIKGYVQLVKIAITVVAAVLTISALVDESPVIFLSGLGAMTAVLLLVFRDTILSLVASVQISGNDMVRVGDWIEMPQFGADGDVTDVALHTVQVQNWDKTITTIPTHRLISDSFKNWRYMSLSGGRRIKRSLQIDVASVRFLSDDELERFGDFHLLRDYVTAKRAEVSAFNQGPALNSSHDADIRRLTNLGTYRAYLDLYLHAHPKIHQGMTLMVRQLAPTPEGIPLELYCFTTTTDWGEYEDIQADLFDRFIALAPQFGLRVFQAPAGSDLAALSPR